MMVFFWLNYFMLIEDPSDYNTLLNKDKALDVFKQSEKALFLPFSSPSCFLFEKHETKSLILGEEERSKSLVKSGIKFDISM